MAFVRGEARRVPLAKDEMFRACRVMKRGGSRVRWSERNGRRLAAHRGMLAPAPTEQVKIANSRIYQPPAN